MSPTRDDETTSLVQRAWVPILVKFAVGGGTKQPVERAESFEWNALALAVRIPVLEHLAQIGQTLETLGAPCPSLLSSRQSPSTWPCGSQEMSWTGTSILGDLTKRKESHQIAILDPAGEDRRSAAQPKRLLPVRVPTGSLASLITLPEDPSEG